MPGGKIPQFLLRIKVVSGEGLLGCDRGDVSDPYVKMCQDKEVLFKTTTKDSTLNPVWNEEFGVQLEDINKPFELKVYDKDKIGFDDFMGQTELDLAKFKLNESTDVILHLEAANDKKLLKKTKKDEQALGKIKINIHVSNGEPSEEAGPIESPSQPLPTQVSVRVEESSDAMVKEIKNVSGTEDTKIQALNVLELQKNIKNSDSAPVDNITKEREDETGVFESERKDKDEENKGNDYFMAGYNSIMKENDIFDSIHPNTSITMDDSVPVNEMKDQHKDLLSGFLVNITIISGEDLLPCDKGDVSDPYVKICQDKTVFFKTTHKESTVNPAWNEEFGVQIEDITKPLEIQVYDRDMMTFDDFMGQAELNLRDFKLNESFALTLPLEAANDKKLLKKIKKNEKSLGKIKVNVKVSHYGSTHLSCCPPKEHVEEISSSSLSQPTSNQSAVNTDPGKKVSVKKESGESGFAYLLKFTILSGEDLLPCDKGDVSDPYVKLCRDKTALFKTKNQKSTINPVWNEGSSIQIEEDDIQKPLLLQVFDKDKLSLDDFMGQTELQLDKHKLDEPINVSTQLEAANDRKLIEEMNKKNKQYLGKININYQLSYIKIAKVEESPKEDKSFFKSMKKQLSFNNKGSKQHIGIVHVVLVQAQSLAMGQGGTDCDPYCKLSVGKQKYTSKIIKDNNNPQWKEEFNFFWFEDGDDFLRIETRHNDDRILQTDEFLGSCIVNLRDFPPEVSHNTWRPLVGEKGATLGALNLILTVTCYTKTDSPSLLTNWSPDPEREAQLSEQYDVRNSFNDIKDVGHLTVKVLGAEGLASTDYNRSADPFVVLELKNARVRTHTINKSLNPEWNQVFQFDVKDMNERLEVTVYDENENTKEDFLGKVMIPLHKVVDGDRRWFVLKDKQLWQQASGKNPRILLEINLHWNPVRAACRTIKEAEPKYMEKLDTKFTWQSLKYSYNRIKKKISKFEKKIHFLTGKDFDETKKKIQSILDWDSPAKSSFACLVFVLTVWMFDIWMIPFALLIPFILRFVGILKSDDTKKEVEHIDHTNCGEEDEKSTFARMKQIGLIAQTNISYLADVIESVEHIFKFSVPFLSKLAFLAFLLLTIVLYFVPFRICVICWGLHKLTLRLIFPGHKLFNQSLLNFILASPNDKMVEWCREVQEDTEEKTETTETDTIS